MANIRKRSITIAGHRTSISLEQEFWDALKEIAFHNDISLSQLVEHIDKGRSQTSNINLSSHLRLYALDHFRRAASEKTQPSSATASDPE